MDGQRLVFPPLPAIPIVTCFYFFYVSFLPYPIFNCFVGGKLFGYVIYDLTHYYLHHGSPAPKSNLHYLKVYHYNHHFKDFNLGMFSRWFILSNFFEYLNFSMYRFIYFI